MIKNFTIILMFLICNICQGTTSTLKTTKTVSLYKDANFNISFIIVEHTNARGDLNRFSVSQEPLNPEKSVNAFSILLPNAQTKDFASITGVVQIGDDVWTFVDQGVVRISDGKLVIHTKTNVKDGESGIVRLISKEPYRTIKVVGNVEQNVTEFIDVGVNITAKPTAIKGDIVSVAVDMKISEVLRESNNEERDTNVPVISFRDVQTVVNMEIMQLKVLSELSVDKKVKTEKGIPYLRRIPYIGRLFFATTEDSYETTKLYIVGGIVPSGGQDLEEFYKFKEKVETIAKERSDFK